MFKRFFKPRYDNWESYWENAINIPTPHQDQWDETQGVIGWVFSNNKNLKYFSLNYFIEFKLNQLTSALLLYTSFGKKICIFH